MQLFKSQHTLNILDAFRRQHLKTSDIEQKIKLLKI